MDANNDLLSQLTPEQLSALLQGGTLQDKGTLLQQQLADLLGSGMQHQEHSTPLGAGLGGIAEALDGTANAFHAKALRGQQQQNLDAQGKLMGDFGALLRGPQKDPASEFALPAFGPSSPPMVDAGPVQRDPMHGGVFPELDLTAAAPSDPMRGGVFPEMDLTAKPNQPADPTAIVDDGSDGWGLDLSDPKHLAAILRGQQMTPSTDISKLSEVANLQLPGKRRPFSY